MDTETKDLVRLAFVYLGGLRSLAFFVSWLCMSDPEGILSFFLCAMVKYSNNVDRFESHHIKVPEQFPTASSGVDLEVLTRRRKSMNFQGQVRRCFTVISGLNFEKPITEEYRNKDEFNVRPGVDGNPKTVGFYVGRPNHGYSICVPPTEIKIIKKKHRLLAQAYQDFIRTSPLDACYDFTMGGFWRGITVRSNRQDDTMVTVTVHPNGCVEDEIETVKRDLETYFKSLNIPITSFYFQKCQHTRCTQDTAPYELLFGEPYIYEIIGDYSFRISPGSFFQVNVDAAYAMFESVIRFSNLTESTTLLDLCCGTGVISLMASKFARGCIGIESVSEAVNDAVFNARNNEVTNCHFICGRVETKLSAAIDHLENSGKLGVVLNPGRAGVNQHVIKSVLHNCLIDRIVYIACKADCSTTMKNFAALCAKRAKSDIVPFTLTHVQPVDMFPHTNHCELIMLFQR